MISFIEHIGPSLWHGREINSCTRCKYLRCQLVKSGRHPDYEYFCMHPAILAGDHKAAKDVALLDKVKEKFPDKLEYFQKSVASHNADVREHGEFISNDSNTPETPEWCPVTTKQNL